MDKRFPRRYNPHHRLPYRPPKKPRIGLLAILGIIFILVVAGVSSLFLFFSGDGTNEDSSSEISQGSRSSVVGCQEDWICAGWGDCMGGTQERVCSDSNDCGTTEGKPIIGRDCVEDNETLSNESSSENTTLVSCDDWDCLIESSRNCGLSEFTTSPVTIDLFGISITTTSYYGITEKESGICTFKLRIEEQHVNYSEEFIQFQLASGSTQEEIDETLQIGNQAADLLEGRDGTCNFNAPDLTDVLTRWSQGSFSGGVTCSFNSGILECEQTGDFEVAQDCEGEYFMIPGSTIHEDENCKIQVSISSMGLLKGISSIIGAYGFDDASNVSWSGSNETVATIDPITGATVSIKAEEIGLTNITATDNSVGPHCKASFPLEVIGS
ncbi:MAG TPA: Ig-like domain-containing protein [Candidatus Pacearchaeota archaeon]|nr:Ig-like domain-containing protein [Candidatus Pacearchaeota archaeon]